MLSYREGGGLGRLSRLICQTGFLSRKSGRSAASFCLSSMPSRSLLKLRAVFLVLVRSLTSILHYFRN